MQPRGQRRLCAASSEAFGSGTVTVGPSAVDRTSRPRLARVPRHALDNVRKRLRDLEQCHTPTSTAVLALNATSCVLRSSARPAKAASPSWLDWRGWRSGRSWGSGHDGRAAARHAARAAGAAGAALPGEALERLPDVVDDAYPYWPCDES